MPADLKGQLLYIWEILDVRRVNLDRLFNIMAFELKMGPPAKCKALIKQAIAEKLLIEDTDLEEVELDPKMRSQFEEWQKEGTEKAKKMKGVLEKSWREPFNISEQTFYTVLERELFDIMVRNQAEKRFLSSAVKLDQSDFMKEISGSVSVSQPDGTSMTLPFKIDITKHQIIHDCSEYGFRKKQKRFCIHLARVIMKLYVLDAVKTTQLVQNIVQKRADWNFV
jgi:capsid protein